MSPRSVVPLLALTGVLAGCRIQSPELSWVECYGHAQAIDLAASAHGVVAVGTHGKTYRYPGEWSSPWYEVSGTQGKAVASSSEAVYVLANDGSIERTRWSDKSVAKWPWASAWRATALAADERDELFVLANGAAQRVRGHDLVPLACPPRAMAIAAGEGDAYVVIDGAVKRAREDRCEDVPTPPRVSSLTVYGPLMAVVTPQGPVRRDATGAWTALPTVAKPGPGGRVVDLRMSRYWVWARDEEQHVYVLSEP